MILVSGVSDLINEAAHLARVGYSGDCKRKSTRKTRSKTWFDKKCAKWRRDFCCITREINRHPINSGLQQRFRDVRRAYDRSLESKRNCFRLGILSQMERLSSNNPAQYWNLFNKLSECRKSANSILGKEWLGHFSGFLNGVNSGFDVEFVVRAENFVRDHGDPIFP